MSRCGCKSSNSHLQACRCTTLLSSVSMYGNAWHSCTVSIHCMHCAFGLHQLYLLENEEHHLRPLRQVSLCCTYDCQGVQSSFLAVSMLPYLGWPFCKSACVQYPSELPSAVQVCHQLLTAASFCSGDAIAVPSCIQNTQL